MLYVSTEKKFDEGAPCSTTWLTAANLAMLVGLLSRMCLPTGLLARLSMTDVGRAWQKYQSLLEACTQTYLNRKWRWVGNFQKLKRNTIMTKHEPDMLDIWRLKFLKVF